MYTISSSNAFLYQNNDSYELRVQLGYYCLKQVALCAELIFNSSVQFLHLQHQQCWLPIQGMSLSIEFAHYYSQHNRNLFFGSILCSCLK